MSRTIWGIAIVTLAVAGQAVAEEVDVVVLRGVAFSSELGPNLPLCLSSERSVSISGYYEVHFRLPLGMAEPYFPATLRGQRDRDAFRSDRYLRFRCHIRQISAGLAMYPAMRHTADRAELLARAVSKALERQEVFGFEVTKPNSTATLFLFLTAPPR